MKKILGLATIVATALILVSPVYADTLYRQLQLGMSGSDVTSLQVFLAKDPSIYPQGLVTGYFGVLTRAAVSNFQARNGIAVVGRVGPITMAAINAQMGGATGADIYAPTIGSISVSTSNNGATINWNTSENSTAVVYYSTSPIPMTESSATTGVVIGGNNLQVNSDFRSSHTAVITGLSSNTTYYYVLYVRDANGNESITWPATFQTSL